MDAAPRRLTRDAGPSRACAQPPRAVARSGATLKRIESTLLVAAQFALIALIVWIGRPGSWGVAEIALALSGAALGAWSLSANRPGNFNIRPEPKAGGILVTSGPYRWVRHPMYSAVLLFSAAFALYAGGAGWAAWAALGFVLWRKSRLEERALVDDPRYAQYMSRVGGFVPRIF